VRRPLLKGFVCEMPAALWILWAYQRRAFWNNSEPARLLRIDSSTVSRRFEGGEKRIKGRAELDGIIKEVRKRYRSKSQVRKLN